MRKGVIALVVFPCVLTTMGFKNTHKGKDSVMMNQGEPNDEQKLDGLITLAETLVREFELQLDEGYDKDTNNNLGHAKDMLVALDRIKRGKASVKTKFSRRHYRKANSSYTFGAYLHVLVYSRFVAAPTKSAAKEALAALRQGYLRYAYEHGAAFYQGSESINSFLQLLIDHKDHSNLDFVLKSAYIDLRRVNLRDYTPLEWILYQATQAEKFGQDAEEPTRQLALAKLLWERDNRQTVRDSKAQYTHRNRRGECPQTHQFIRDNNVTIVP